MKLIQLRRFILAFLLTVSCFSRGQTLDKAKDLKEQENDEIVVKDPHHKGTISSLNLGFRYSSILQNRGLVLYRDFQIDPTIAIFFFDDRLEFVGDSIGYRDFIYEDRIRLRTRIVSITDKPLFPSYESLRAGRPTRSDSYEWSNRAELFLPGYNDRYWGELDIGFAKDLSTHHGTYIDLQAKLKLFDFRVPGLKTKVEPNFSTSVGWGDSAHNQYLYGPSANEGSLNNFSAGLWLAFPEEADRFYPVIQLTHFEVLGQNRNAEFATGNNEGWLFSFIATYGVLE